MENIIVEEGGSIKGLLFSEVLVSANSYNLMLWGSKSLQEKLSEQSEIPIQTNL